MAVVPPPPPSAAPPPAPTRACPRFSFAAMVGPPHGARRSLYATTALRTQARMRWLRTRRCSPPSSQEAPWRPSATVSASRTLCAADTSSSWSVRPRIRTGTGSCANRCKRTLSLLACLLAPCVVSARTRTLRFPRFETRPPTIRVPAFPPSHPAPLLPSRSAGGASPRTSAAPLRRRPPQPDSPASSRSAPSTCAIMRTRSRQLPPVPMGFHPGAHVRPSTLFRSWCWITAALCPSRGSWTRDLSLRRSKHFGTTWLRCALGRKEMERMTTFVRPQSEIFASSPDSESEAEYICKRSLPGATSLTGCALCCAPSSPPTARRVSNAGSGAALPPPWTRSCKRS